MGTSVDKEKEKEKKKKDKGKEKEREKDREKEKKRKKKKEKEKEKEKERKVERTAEELALLQRRSKFEELPPEMQILKDENDQRSRSRKKKDDKKKHKSKHSKRSHSSDKKKKRSQRLDSPPKSSQERDRFDQLKINSLNSSWGDNVDPIKNPIAALEALQHMNPLIMMQKMQLMRAQSDVKADRKLYVGNLPSNTTTSELQDFLNQGLLKMGVNIDVIEFHLLLAGILSYKLSNIQPGPCIVSTWINTDGHFGFVEFRNPEEATQGFCLNNVVYNGMALKIGRPKSFLSQLQQANQQSILENPISVLGSLKVENIDISNFIPLQLKPRTIQTPTKVIMLKHILTLEDLTIDEEYVDIMEDVKDECERYGRVQNIIIPRPAEGAEPHETKGLGRIIVEMRNVDEAKNVRRNIAGRLYMDRTVEVTFLSEDRYVNGDFIEIQ